MNLILLILGRLYNINISSYTKTIQIMQYYYAINRASRRCPPRAVIVTPRTFQPCRLHAPRINTSHSTSQFTTSHFRTSQFTHALVYSSVVRYPRYLDTYRSVTVLCLQLWRCIFLMCPPVTFSKVNRHH